MITLCHDRVMELSDILSRHHTLHKADLMADCPVHRTEITNDLGPCPTWQKGPDEVGKGQSTAWEGRVGKA